MLSEPQQGSLARQDKEDVTPPELLAEHRAAAARRSARPVSVAAAAVMVALWLAAGALLWRWLAPSAAALLAA